MRLLLAWQGLARDAGSGLHAISNVHGFSHMLLESEVWFSNQRVLSAGMEQDVWFGCFQF